MSLRRLAAPAAAAAVVAARSAREASDGGPAPPGGPAAARCKGIDANSFSGNVMDHAALRHGFPQTSYVAASEAFVASFDFRTRNAQWVVEHLTSESVRLDEAERKGETFHEVPERFRSRLSDYAGSGYDRGHLAPAADHKASAKAMHDSFCLINVSPQVGVGFNRDYWARLEKFCRQLTNACDEVVVVTGPLFLPSDAATLRADHATLGKPPSLLHVPTHFFKVILSETRARGSGGAGYAVAAFVLPNAAIAAETPLTDFVVPLEALEAAAGVFVFQQLLTPERRDKLRLEEMRFVNHRKCAQKLLAAPPAANGKAKATALPTDIAHLCDRHRCRLGAAIVFNNHK